MDDADLDKEIANLEFVYRTFTHDMPSGAHELHVHFFIHDGGLGGEQHLLRITLPDNSIWDDPDFSWPLEDVVEVIRLGAELAHKLTTNAVCMAIGGVDDEPPTFGHHRDVDRRYTHIWDACRGEDPHDEQP